MRLSGQLASASRRRATGRGARRGALVLAALLFAGCANNPPAPVVNRSPTPARPATAPAPTPPPAAPAHTPPATSADGATTAPVRGGTVEGRPLEPRGSVRTGPRGFKRPYTDSVYAEMLAEAGAAPPPVAAPASPAGAAPAGATPTGPSGPASSPPQAPAGGAPGAPAAPAAAPASPGAAAGTPATSASAPSAAASAATGPEGGFAWPSAGRVVQGFDAPKSMGLSIAGKVGDPVLASADGRVIFSGPGPRGYGNLVIVRHEGDTLSVYGHNRTLLVKEGAAVRRGQRIAEMGDSDGGQPRLLFEIRRGGKPVDPARLLPPR